MPERILRTEERERLIAQGCSAADWGEIRVDTEWTPERVRRVRFQGRVHLGGFQGGHTLPGGVEHPSGVYDTTLRDVTVGADALVAHVPGGVSGYDIGAGACVFDVRRLVAEAGTRFGQVRAIPVMPEAGGRPVPLLWRMGVQVAWCLAFLPHRNALRSAVESMVASFLDATLPPRGMVGEGARILHAGMLDNVWIQGGAEVEGAVRLCRGVVERGGRVGAGVDAEDFAVASGGCVEGGARLTGCFVGQGARVGGGFSAQNSLFFANAEAMEGEACSFFAGPFSVSHHKASLLLTSAASFYNAGSGTNFSNHRYKSGPVHAGILERGCKTGSGSYLLWPGRIGAFTAVIGRHTGTFDTNAMPFSYLLEDKGRSLLLPGANLFTVGTFRDVEKWRTRDRRADGGRRDLIHTDAFSPYTMDAVLRGRAELTRLSRAKGERSNVHSWGGAVIPGEWITKGHVVYDAVLQIHRGRVVARRLLDGEGHADPAARLAVAEVRGLPGSDAGSGAGKGVSAGGGVAGGTGVGAGAWLDVGGMYIPQETFSAILSDVEAGRIADLDALEGAFAAADAAYADAEWNWVRARWVEELGREPGVGDVAGVSEGWSRGLERMGEMVRHDMGKEYSRGMRTGFGVADGDVEAEFSAVRGGVETHAFTVWLEDALQAESARASALAALA